MKEEGLCGHSLWEMVLGNSLCARTAALCSVGGRLFSDSFMCAAFVYMSLEVIYARLVEDGF